MTVSGWMSRPCGFSSIGRSEGVKRTVFLTGVIAFVGLASNRCARHDGIPILKGPYLGQSPPGQRAELFDPGFFPENEYLGCSGFLNEGTVFIYTSMRPNADWRLRPTYVTEMKKGKWTAPRIAPFSRYAPYNFTVGPDGQTLYFTTLKSPDKTTHVFLEQANIWAVKLEMDGWTEPVMFGRSINTDKYYENYPSVTVNGTVYYMSRREDGIGRTDVYRSRNLDGKYGKTENLGIPVNTEESDIDPFVAPDESYLIVCREAAGGYGSYDLYIHFQRHDGSWTGPVNMGEEVNSSGFEARPYVTPDGKFLLFTSNRPNQARDEGIYWVDARVIAELRQDALERP